METIIVSKLLVLAASLYPIIGECVGDAFHSFIGFTDF